MKAVPRRWRLAAVASGALALALLPLLLHRGASPYSLTVPLPPSPGAAYLELASTLRLGRPYGLDLQTLPREEPGQVLQDYLDGRASVVPLSSAEALWICQQQPRRCPRLVLVLSTSRGGDSVLVRRDLVDLQGLRGQPVGISPQDGGLWLLLQALASAGLPLASVRLVPTSPLDMPRLLGRGQLGGAVLAPPFRERSLLLGDSRRLFDSGPAPAGLQELLAVDPAYADQHRPSLRALVLAWQEAHLLASRDPGRTLPVLGWATRLSPSGFRAAETGFAFFGLGLQRQMLAPEGSVAIELAALRKIGRTLGLSGADGPLPTPSAELVQAALDDQARRSLPK